ncbi:hypothetical protein EGI16_03645 [Chryseobacterium sp. G0240]|uniref:hypothetical protein n=1 Tax=Chryseobacterium sp. G0240 TaxID=2487066 RepID=UPI000F456FDF|nr:hypothetical protein [Chryseobacterium sp. G0240]ROI05491.1 hypothetical protein EGI16_03645 [Chryseobacterium sp. G0240]
MKILLETFFSTVKNEFGDNIDFSNINSEGFIGVICINDHSADISVRIDDYQEYDNDLTDEENSMLNAFVSYTQQEMKNQIAFIKNTTND